MGNYGILVIMLMGELSKLSNNNLVKFIKLNVSF